MAAVLVVISISLPAADTRAWHRLPPGRDGFHAAGYEGVRGVTIGPIENASAPAAAASRAHASTNSR